MPAATPHGAGIRRAGAAAWLGIGAAALAAAALAVALARGIPPGGAGARTVAGGAGRQQAAQAALGDQNVNPNLQRLAPVTPRGDRDFWNDGTPIVLWSGPAPGVILQYQHRRSLEKLTVEQTLAVVDGSQRKGPFPLGYRTKLASNQRGPSADALSAEDVVPADLDGDGAQELVAFRVSGAVEVHGLGRTLFHDRPQGGVPMTPHRVRLGAREVLLFPLGPPPRDDASVPPAVIRVDAHGITHVRLAGIPQDAELLAVGSVVRPGAADLDEIVAVSKAGRETLLSRHRPDGRPIGEARAIYVPYPSVPGVELRSLPASGRNVALDGGDKAVLFVAPTKPVNWIRRVDVSRLAGGDVELVGTLDDAAAAKAVVRGGDALYAIDEEGRWWVPSGAGWAAHEKPEPFVRLPAAGPGEKRVGVFPSGERDDEWLVVHTRAATIRDLPHDELVRAAERFLKPFERGDLTDDVTPRFDDYDRVRDEELPKELRAKGVAREITTAEEWKRWAPESYAASLAVRERRRDAHVRASLLDRRGREPGSTRYLNADEYRAWLRSVETPAETRLSLVRRSAIAATLSVPGEVVNLVESDVALEPVDFRSRGSDLVAVLALQGSAGPAAPPDPALYLVRTAGAR